MNLSLNRQKKKDYHKTSGEQYKNGTERRPQQNIKEEAQSKQSDSFELAAIGMDVKIMHLKTFDSLPSDERPEAIKKFLVQEKQKQQSYVTFLSGDDATEIQMSLDKLKQIPEERQSTAKAKIIADNSKEAQLNNIYYELSLLYLDGSLTEAQAIESASMLAKESFGTTSSVKESEKTTATESLIRNAIETADKGLFERLKTNNRLVAISTEQKYTTVEKHLDDNDGKIDEAKLQGEFEQQMKTALKDEPALLMMYQSMSTEFAETSSVAMETTLAAESSVSTRHAKKIVNVVKDLKINTAYAVKSITTDENGNVHFSGAAQQLDGIVTTYNFTLKKDGKIVVKHDNFEENCSPNDLAETVSRGELYSVFYARTVKMSADKRSKEEEALVEPGEPKKALDEYISLFQERYKSQKNIFIVFQKVTEQLFIAAADKSQTVGLYLHDLLGAKSPKSKKAIIDGNTRIAESALVLTDTEKNGEAEQVSEKKT